MAAPDTRTEYQKFIDEVKEKKGANIIMPATHLPLYNSVSTGIFLLDFALMGGLPQGQAAMFFGPENSGKTTLIDKCVAGLQRKTPWRKGLWVDMEHTWDRDWAKVQGVDLSRVDVVRPIKGEDAVDISIAAMEAWETDFVVLDSIPSCIPHKIIEDSAADANVSPLARLMGNFSAKILMSWADQRRRGHYVTVIFANQWREKIGVMYGDPRTLPGGKQIRHLCMTMCELKNKKGMGDDQFGISVHLTNDQSFKFTKAKTGSCIDQGEFQVAVAPDTGYKPGTPIEAKTVTAYAKKMGIIAGGGQKWILDQRDDIPFKSLGAVEDFLDKDPNELLLLKQLIISKMRVSKGLPPLPPDGYLLDWNARHNVLQEE